ncbi:DoxX family protein [Segniliparus rotundus DSM 44985]|uniref:DoxX family protein n=1 Tax=Segniliparus rotundus (strain ATCC BAA-972 / CDC 1076 / CIP 108378 / DSM 44985 / JCM 13578) TaxID=640132 RepID=D6ZCH8_SEGRD|nr:DoxX family protein [Segniliparus rotundus]ADG97020.1 DoxX family protein [Segniliparus rotundus DSM 44985]
MPVWVRDFALLVLRLGCAFCLIPHGWNKVTNWGFSGTAAGFAQMGVPYPELSAAVAIAAELVGAVLLALGLLTPLASSAVIVAMLGGLLTAPNHVFTGGGMTGGLLPWHTAGKALDRGVGFLDEKWLGVSAFQFCLLGLAVLITGPGGISLDWVLFKHSRWLAPRS